MSISFQSLARSGKGKGKGKSSSNDLEYTFDVWASGDQEFPGAVVTETTAVAELTIDKFMRYIDFDLDVSNGVGITAAHLHCGKAGTFGGVVVALASTPVGVTVDGHYEAGRITNADISDPGCNLTIPMDSVVTLVDAMVRGDIYFNVHSLANPPGEVRGQVFLGIEELH